MTPNIVNKKVVFIDLDDTLIRTRSGKTFPQGIWDMELNLGVFDALKALRPKAVCVVSNQGGIEAGYVDVLLFQSKLMYVLDSLKDYLKTEKPYVEARYCPSTAEDNHMRKPNPGMLEAIFSTISERIGEEVTKEDCVMIGDASGKEGDYSDSDRKTAENFGIDYMDVEKFVSLYSTLPKRA